MESIAAEQECCMFFRFAITVDTRGVALEVTAPVAPIDQVCSLFGTSRSVGNLSVLPLVRSHEGV